MICTFPVIGGRGLVPALSHFEADLDAVGVALAEQLLALQPGAPAELGRPASRLVPLRFVPRDSHQPAAPRVRA